MAIDRSVVEKAAGLARISLEPDEVERFTGQLSVVLQAVDRFNAWLHLDDDYARKQARSADERLRHGDAPVLCGIPWACKDIIGTKAIPTTAGSKILEGYVPAYSATVVDRLDAQGAVMLGKT